MSKRKSNILFEVFAPLIKEDKGGLWDSIGKPMVHYTVTPRHITITHKSGYATGTTTKHRRAKGGSLAAAWKLLMGQP